MKKTVKLKQAKKVKPTKPHAFVLPKKNEGKKGTGEITLDETIL